MNRYISITHDTENNTGILNNKVNLLGIQLIQQNESENLSYLQPPYFKDLTKTETGGLSDKEKQYISKHCSPAYADKAKDIKKVIKKKACEG